MAELEPLATALRNELGPPPDAWQQAQRARLRVVLRDPPRRRAFIRGAAPVFAALVLFSALLWVALRPSSSNEVERWLVAEELRGPFRFEDGSSISLGRGGRGRLHADDTSVRFDLHQGRAEFDVTRSKPRTWTITAGKNEVRVVGTRFSVSFGPEETFEVEVERGVVSVRVPDRNASVELAAGDHLRGRPGRMEVAHGAARVKAPAATTNVEQGDAPTELVPPAPPARSEPAPSGMQNEWQARYRDGKYAESLALLRSSGIAKRLDELSPRTLADVADAARLGGDPDLAIRALNVLLRRFPSAAEARDGKFLLGRVHALRGDRNAAIGAFERYLETKASAPYTNEAMGRLMELYSARGDNAKARSMAERYLERTPDGPYRRLARSLVGESP
jgi:TolA-binding protein